MILAVGSKNAAKIRAVEMAYQQLLSSSENKKYLPLKVIVKGFDAKSLVSDQPLSDQETMQGAINRAKAALECDSEAVFGIGIEGGIQQVGDKYFESGWIAIVDRNGKIGLGTSARFELSSKIADRLYNGEELATVIDDLSNQTDVRSTLGAMGILSGGCLNRDLAYSHGIIFAFAPFISHEKYWN